MRDRLTYANVMATIAVFVALGGTSVAAISLSRNSVKGKHIARNAITSPKVKDASLFGKDFAPGQLPQGEPGLQGAQGAQGTQGERGLQGEKGETGNTGATGPSMGRSVTVESCDPDSGAFSSCAGLLMDLPTAGRVLVVAATEWNDNGGSDASVAASCRVRVDSTTQIGPLLHPGQKIGAHSVTLGSPGILHDGSTALTAVSAVLPQGVHAFSLECNELDADIFLRDQSLSAVLLGPG